MRIIDPNRLPPIYRSKRLTVLLLFALWINSVGHLQAVITASVQSGDWENTGTWSCGCVPGASDTITISGGTTVKLNAKHFTGDLTVNGVLDMNSQFIKFEGTAFTNNGAIVSTVIPKFGEIDFNGVGGANGTTQTIAGTGSYATGGSFPIEIDVINGTTVTPAIGTSISGVRNFVVRSGSKLSVPHPFMFANGVMNSEFGGTVLGAGLLLTQGSTGLSFQGQTSVALEVVNGSTMAAGSLGQVTIDANATLQTVGSTTVSDVTISKGAVLDLVNQFVQLQGTTFTNNGIIIDGSNKFGEIDFNGVAGAHGTSQTIVGSGQYGNPKGPSTIHVHVINGTTALIAPGTTISGLSDFSLFNESALSIPGTFGFADGSISGEVGSTIFGSGIVQARGTTALALNGSTTTALEVVDGITTAHGNFGNITVDNAAALMADGTLKTGDLTISSGALFDTANQLIEFQGAAFSNNGSVTCTSSGTGTINFGGVGGLATTTQTWSGTGIYNNGGPVNLLIHSNVTVSSGTMLIGITNLTTFSGASLSFFGNGSVVLAGSVSNDGSIQFNGGGPNCGDPTKIFIRSNIMGVQRAWAGKGTFSMTDLDVEDQAGSALIAIAGGIDSGDNGDNWMITATCSDSTPTPSPSVTPSPTPHPAHLLNISTRLNDGTGENALIGGFIVTGTVPERVILRGIGPSLSGIFPDALTDPTLSLYRESTLIQSNDNWRSDQETEIIATGLAPSNNLESALIETTARGAYSVVLQGNNNSTGVALVEVYELDASVDSMLANISARGLVGTDDNVIIGGFIIGPSNGGETTVLVRGIGPSLSNSGIAQPLQDPTLELINASGVIIHSNNNWRDSQETQIIATGLPPSDDRESAILETVAPGSFTAILRGNANTSGIGLVEIYRLQ